MICQFEKYLPEANNDNEAGRDCRARIIINSINIFDKDFGASSTLDARLVASCFPGWEILERDELLDMFNCLSPRSSLTLLRPQSPPGVFRAFLSQPN